MLSRFSEFCVYCDCSGEPFLSLELRLFYHHSCTTEVLTARENTGNMQEACAIVNPTKPPKLNWSFRWCFSEGSNTACGWWGFSSLFMTLACYGNGVMARTLGLDLERSRFKSGLITYQFYDIGYLDKLLNFFDLQFPHMQHKILTLILLGCCLDN